MITFKIGVRSVTRNRRRTLVTVAAMAFGGIIMVIYSALFEGFFYTLERNAVGMDLADVQVHAKGYRRDPDLYTRIDDADAIAQRLRARGLGVTTRLFGYGLAAAEASAAGVTFRGLDPVHEGDATRLPTALSAGRWLSADDPKGVVLGRRLTRTLNVEVGSEVVVMSQAADGSMANDLYRVRGILKGVNDAVDRGGFLMTQSAFRQLLAVPTGVHEIVVRRPAKTMTLLQAKDTVAAASPEYETVTWKELQPVLAQSLQTSFASQLFLMIIMYVAIAMLVLNATLMSVFERIREFGIMKALGVTPVQVISVILIEVLGQAVLACAVAAGVGIPIAMWLAQHGIDLSAFMEGTSAFGVALDPVWYAVVSPQSILVPIGSLVVIAVVAAAYPGLRAAWMGPLDAIHYQ